jgi:hypothetical protein
MGLNRPRLKYTAENAELIDVWMIGTLRAICCASERFHFRKGTSAYGVVEVNVESLPEEKLTYHPSRGLSDGGHRVKSLTR